MWLLILKGNRNRKAWAVLIPLVALNAIAYLAIKIPPLVDYGSTAIDLFLLAQQLTLGACALWLLSPWLAKEGAFLRFVYAVLILAGLAEIGILCFNGVQSTTTVFAIIAAVLSLSIVGALALARIACRKHFGPWRYFFGTAASLAVVISALFSVYVCVALLAMDSAYAPPFLELVSALFYFTGVSTGLVLAGLAPFLLLTFNSPFYRERFHSSLGIPAENKPL